MTRAIEHNTLNQSHITDKTQTQKELKDRNERLELVLEATGAGVWDYDLVNNRNYIDKRCKAILGYEENEITDELEEWRSRWYIEDSEKITEAIRLCEEGKTDQFDLEYRLQHKNGSYLWVRSIGRFIYNEQCEPIRAVGTISDITERYEVERMLKFTYELQRKSDFINDILSGNISLTEKTLGMAEKLKINFRGSLCCFLINVIENSDKDQKDQRINDHSKQMVNRLIYLISYNTNYLVWNNCDKIGVLCESNLINDSNTPKDLTQSSIMTASELKAFLSNAEPGLTISIGISDFHSGIDCIKNSYKEAWNTLISAQCQIHKDGGVFHYKDVGLFQILSLIYEQDYSSEFVRKMIGCIIDYDKEKGSDLLITLEEILQSNNLKDAANRLYIHYKTLVFRKRRIEEILGVSLESVDTRLALAAAIKLHRLINTSISLLKRTPKEEGNR